MMLQPVHEEPFRKPHKNTAWQTWVCQTDALLRKNAEVLLRQARLLCLIICLPAIAALILWVIQISSGDPTIKTTILSPKTCSVFNFDNSPNTARSCVSVAFTPNNSVTHDLMQAVAKEAGWEFGNEVKVVNNVTELALMAFNGGNLAGLDAGIVFESTVGPSVAYTMYVNQSAPYAANGDYFHFGGLQLALDKAIIKMFTNMTPDISVTVSPFSDQSIGTAAASSDVLNSDLTHYLGAVLILFAVVFNVIIILYLITSEKKAGLISQMRMMGLMDSALWLSWFLVLFVVDVVMALVFAAVAVATPVLVFRNTAFGVLYFYMLCTMICGTGFAFFCASFLRQPKWVSTMSFMVVVTWLVTTLMFQLLQLSNTYYAPGTSTFTQFMLWTQPWFHFSKIFEDLVTKTASGEFKWSDISNSPPPPNQFAPSVGQSLGNMVGLGLVYMVLAWYIGQVWGGDFSKKFYFFFTRSYWGYHRVDAHIFQGDTQAEVRQQSIEHGDVRLHKMSKSYDQTTALKELSLTMRRGEIFCLLGQNGAGKSTAINCLTGLHNCTHGNAFVFGLSVNHEMPEIQSMMGVCSQDDFLFPDLSGSAHLAFWARFKGLSRQQVGKEVARALGDVSLTSAASAPASTYSGGMKRRLSVAIASMGDPQIIFLDEPTTGLDPLSRRRVWGMIERLKEGRVICLTTHSMEEADVLGNEIAILASGRLRAIGTSLFLKNRFGKGYQVALMSTPDDADQLVGVVKQMLPGVDIISNSAGYITIGIPKGVAAFIPRFFKYLETEGSHMVKEWGISNTTLEEVFLRLAVQNKEVNSTGIQSEEGAADRLIVEPIGAGPIDVTRSDGAVLSLQEVSVVTGLGVNMLPHISVYTLTMPAETQALAEPLAESLSPLPVVPQPQAIEYKQPATDVSIQQSPAPKMMDMAEKFGEITMWKQIRGLLLKSAALQRTQRKTNCCFLFFLVSLCFVSVLLGILLPSAGGSSSRYTVCTPDMTNNCVCPTSGASWNPETYYSAALCFPDGFVTYMTSPDRCNSNKCNLAKSLCVGLPGNNTCTSNTQPGGDYSSNTGSSVWVSTTDSRNQCGWQTLDLAMEERVWVSEAPKLKKSFFDYDLTGLGNGTSEIWYQTSSGTNTGTLKFTKVQTSVEDAVAASQKELLKGLTSTDGMYCSYSCQPKYAYIEDISTAEAHYKSLFPDFGLDIYRSDPENMTLAYNLAVFAQASTSSSSDYYSRGSQYPLATIFTTKNYDCAVIGPDPLGFRKNRDPQWTATPAYNLATVIGGMTRVMLNTAKNPNLTEIKARVIQMPVPDWMGRGISVDPMILIAMCVLPMATMLGFTSIVQSTLIEKSTKVVVMMKMQGLNAKMYWFATWLWHMGTYIFFVGFFVILNFATGAQPYTKCDAAGLILTLLVWGNAMIGMAFLFSAFFSRGPLAVVLSLALVMVQIVLGSVVLFTLPLGTTTWPAYLDLIPQMSFEHALVISLSNDGKHVGDFWQAIGLLFLEGVVLLFVGTVVQIARLEDSADGSFWAHFQCCKSKGEMEQSLLDESEAVEEDIDVREERMRVKAGIENDALQLNDFGKTFPGVRGRSPKVAVKSTSLSVGYGECFGLLGPNGAGKTTTLNILSGYMDPSRGTAKICGFDVVKDIKSVHKVLGMCPQFDWVWEELTVAEHLLLYVRLKGAFREAEPALVQGIATAVGLDGDALGTVAGSLSGGMRRRLSLAIALCGDPRVIFLDEPTTGLDPETRQEMWKTISNTKTNRCIVLTTHSMEEADALCERIGIMAEGSLQCLGTQLHLKSRFGSGYQLKLSLENSPSPELLQAIDNFVATLSSTAPRLTSTVGGRTRAYNLDRQSTSISHVFATMERRSHDLEIREWGITMTTLDEVFLHIVEAAEQAQRP